VFEGVGHLIATILVGAAEQIQRINDNGVKKMCRNIYALQQTLSNITKQPEHALDKARQYYELFFHTPEVLIIYATSFINENRSCKISYLTTHFVGTCGFDIRERLSIQRTGVHECLKVIVP